MKRNIAITINILGIICVFMPYIIVWLGFGSEAGSIAIIGGEENPAQLVLFANITSPGMLLTSISTCIFIFNIFVFYRKLKN
jgi:hypothetical protein